MKTKFKQLTFLLLSFCFYKSQQIGIGTTSPDICAILDVSAADKGLLIPRVALLDENDISTIKDPKPGLMIINTGDHPTLVENAIYKFSGTKWNKIITNDSPLNGDITGSVSNNRVSGLGGRMFSLNTLTSGDYLKYNGTNWINSPTTVFITTTDRNTISANVNGVSSPAEKIISAFDMTWTRSTGFTSSINGLSVKINPISSTTISNILGYNSAGNLVYVNPSSLGSINFATGTSGNDINITGSPVALGGTVTINIPDASAMARGLMSRNTQMFSGDKTFIGRTTFSNFTTTITSGTAGNSGLVLTNLPSTSTPSSNPNNVALSVDTSGRVILSALPSASVFDAYGSANQNLPLDTTTSTVASLTQRSTSSSSYTLTSNQVQFNQAGTYLITFSFGLKSGNTLSTTSISTKASLFLNGTEVPSSEIYTNLYTDLTNTTFQNSNRTVVINANSGDKVDLRFIRANNNGVTLSLGTVTTIASATGITIQKIN